MTILPVCENNSPTRRTIFYALRNSGLIDREFMRHRGIDWAAPYDESCNWRNNDIVAWACGIYGCHWRKCNIRLADTAARSLDDFHACWRFSIESLDRVGVTLFSVYFFAFATGSPRREINRSKSETHAAHIRISFVARFDLWKLVSIFFSPPNESCCSLHATRINLCPEPIIQRRRSHWRHKCVTMLRQRDGTEYRHVA